VCRTRTRPSERGARRDLHEPADSTNKCKEQKTAEYEKLPGLADPAQPLIMSQNLPGCCNDITSALLLLPLPAGSCLLKPPACRGGEQTTPRLSLALVQCTNRPATLFRTQCPSPLDGSHQTLLCPSPLQAPSHTPSRPHHQRVPPHKGSQFVLVLARVFSSRLLGRLLAHSGSLRML